jgi:type II secretory pathway component PulJ
MKHKGFTLVELLIAFSIFIVITGLVLVSVTGSFRSLQSAEKVLGKEQRARLCMFRLSKEVSSFTPITYPDMRFKGEQQRFFFIFAREDNLVESGYVYNPASSALEHYYQEPADYDLDSYQTKEACLVNLSDCKFSYSDGQVWQENWEETKGALPRMIKITFKFQDENQEREFLVNIPVSP